MPAFDPLTYRYASRRNVVYAQNAVACTFVLLGAQIGLDVMKSGGSAVDAAVAMAAAMPLLEPTGNGLGSGSGIAAAIATAASTALPPDFITSSPICAPSGTDVQATAFLA